jgi:hypothetical protein
MIVVFTENIAGMLKQVFAVLGRGELMVYAASVCGATLYALRHSIDGPLPEGIKHRVTPLGTLSTVTAVCMVVALISYLVRRMGDLYNIAVNEYLLNTLSILALLFSVLVAYVVFSLKFSLDSGAARASYEQTEDFKTQWEQRDA